MEPTSRLRVVIGEEELLRSRAVAAVRTAVLAHHDDPEIHELTAAGLPVGQLADVLAPSLFGGHRLVVVSGVQEAAAALNVSSKDSRIRRSVSRISPCSSRSAPSRSSRWRSSSSTCSTASAYSC